MELYDDDFCCMELYDKHFWCMEVNPGNLRLKTNDVKDTTRIWFVHLNYKFCSKGGLDPKNLKRKNLVLASK